ncbi:MAG TPA: hypothetical protein VFF76_01145 [Holophagaceae bacterium]|jgi:hypothetical protein|nr:hypothetical protein [Holophagaceae bacterium]
MRPTLLALLLLAPALRADGLADLRAALKSLPARQPVKASVDCQVWNRSGKAKQPKIVQGHARVVVEDGPGGLKLGWDKAELDHIQAATKAKDRGPEQAMAALKAEKAEAMLDSAKELLSDLEGAVVQEDRVDTYQGKATRLLVLKFDDSGVDEEDRKHLKSYSHTLSVWMGPDGTPLGLQDQKDIKGSFFLISFEAHDKASYTFARSGDRLLTAHEESMSSGSGAGQSSEEKTVLDLKL